MSLLDKNQSDNSSKRYKGSQEELTYGQLQAASWYVRHKSHVQNTGIAILLVFAVITVGYSAIYWIGYGAFGYLQDDVNRVELVNSFEDYTALQPAYRAAPVVFADTEVLVESGDNIHLVTSVRNPNPNWIVTITYRYVGDFGETKEDSTVLMPGARGMLSALGVHTSGGARNIRIEIIDFDWGRIDPHLIQDVATFVATRTKFETSNIDISRPDKTRDIPASIQFNVTNDTAYNYVSVPFTVLMYSGDILVGVRPLVIDRFLSGNTESVTYNLGFDSFSISEVEVLSGLHIFDPTSYLSVDE